jgi:hypothetical protein
MILKIMDYQTTILVSIHPTTVHKAVHKAIWVAGPSDTERDLFRTGLN